MKSIEKIEILIGTKRIILAHSKKGERYILTNINGYLSAHWEYTPTHIQVIKQVWNLELIKSMLLNMGAYIDWNNYQWVLNHFNDLNQDPRTIADIVAHGLKIAVLSYSDRLEDLANALKLFGSKVGK